MSVLMRLPIPPRDFNRLVLSPALASLPAKMDSPEARVLVTAICLQESGLAARRQVVDGHPIGPACGLAQFEKNGGVKGVLTHPATAGIASRLCLDACYSDATGPVWSALETNDILAAQLARLLLYTDPAPLPRVGDVQAAWDYYVRCWRPGKPHPDRWPENHAKARAAVLG